MLVVGFIRCHLRFFIIFLSCLARNLSMVNGQVMRSPTDIPSWLIVSQSMAGNPLYMPQQPIFAAGSSSDFVNSWGDYRWNSFYDSNPIIEPDNDTFYQNFPAFLAGTFTTTLTPTTTDAPETTAARPVRDFPDDHSKSVPTVLLAKQNAETNGDRQDAKLSDLILTIVSSLNSALNPTTTTRSPEPIQTSTASTAGPSINNVTPSSSVEEASVGTKVVLSNFSDQQVTAPLEDNSIKVSRAWENRPILSFPAGNSSALQNATQRLVWDLFQVAIARLPPSPKKPPGAVVVSNSFFGALSQKSQKKEDNFSKRAEEASILSNKSTSSNESVEGLIKLLQTSLNRSVEPAEVSTVPPIITTTPQLFPRFRNLPTAVLPALLSSASGGPKSLPAMHIAPVILTNVQTTTVATVSESSADSLRRLPHEVTPQPPASSVSDLPWMPDAMKRRGLCTVMVENKKRIGICVDNSAIQDDCDGMTIKRSKYCAPTMSCCFEILD